MQVEFKIELSQSMKTCGIAIHKKGEEKPFMVIKGCKIVNGQNGPFLSGPATKIDNDWFNYLFMSKEFSQYISEMAVKAFPKQAQGSKAPASGGGMIIDDDIPFAQISKKESNAI